MYRIISTNIEVTTAGIPNLLSLTGSARAVVVAATVSDAATPSVPLITIPPRRIQTGNRQLQPGNPISCPPSANGSNTASTRNGASISMRGRIHRSGICATAIRPG